MDVKHHVYLFTRLLYSPVCLMFWSREARELITRVKSFSAVREKKSCFVFKGVMRLIQRDVSNPNAEYWLLLRSIFKPAARNINYED